MNNVVVYADILILLNTLTDFFILSGAAKLSGGAINRKRTALASLVGGFSTVYIFLPEMPAAVNVLFALFICLVMSLIAFGKGNKKRFFRNFSWLIFVSFCYGGTVWAVFSFFKPNGMIFKNGVVYFNISPTVLILSSVVFYLIITLFNFLLQKNSKTAQKCRVTFIAGENKLTVDGIFDTGNSIKDLFGGEIIITDRKNAEKLFGGSLYPENEALKSRYRVLPCKTVTGNAILDGYKLDKTVVAAGQRSVTLANSLIAVSKTPTDENIAIVNPEIFY